MSDIVTSTTASAESTISFAAALPTSTISSPLSTVTPPSLTFLTTQYHTVDYVFEYNLKKPYVPCPENPSSTCYIYENPELALTVCLNTERCDGTVCGVVVGDAQDFIHSSGCALYINTPIIVLASKSGSSTSTKNGRNATVNERNVTVDATGGLTVVPTSTLIQTIAPIPTRTRRPIETSTYRNEPSGPNLSLILGVGGLVLVLGFAIGLGVYLGKRRWGHLTKGRSTADLVSGRIGLEILAQQQQQRMPANMQDANQHTGPQTYPSGHPSQPYLNPGAAGQKTAPFPSHV
ncbi:hypothetical protein BC829DRAFT_382090 [Chytridium lagenaria]|nr:hypothetical protein BC829DRAFT_382090 [Chytridium lagenaria]